MASSTQQTFKVCIRKSSSFTLPVSGFTEYTGVIMHPETNPVFQMWVTNNIHFIQRVPMHFSQTQSFRLGELENEPAAYILEVSASSSAKQDCDGWYRNATSTGFSSTANVLYFGKGDSIHRCWIPFDITFGVTAGIELVSATLNLIATEESRARTSTAICKIKAGVQAENASTATPTSYADLISRPFTNTYATILDDVETWVDGDEIEIDITSAMQDLMTAGNLSDSDHNTIVWTEGNTGVAMIVDFGSTTNGLRAVASTEHTVYNCPILKIYYRYNDQFYHESVLNDTWMTNVNPTFTDAWNYPLLPVGNKSGTSNKYRSLIKANLSSIPATAIITSASLCMWHETKQATSDGTIKVYRLTQDWDIYGATWNKCYGTKDWTTTGGSSTSDCSFVPELGTLDLSSAEANGWKNIPLDETLITGWLDGTYPNAGMLIKMETESNDYHGFTSSNGVTSGSHPKLDLVYTYAGDTYSVVLQTE